MTKYKVLKSFPSSDGGYHHLAGEIYKPTKSASRTANLERLGYIEEIPKQPKTVWDLKEGDKYYCILDYGGIVEPRWVEKEQYNQECRREAGNIFLTYAEAEKELARHKAKQILLRDTKGFTPDWSDPNQPKFTVSMCHTDMVLSIVCWHIYNYGVIYFASREDARTSIKIHEKEWKVYLGVEDEDL